MELEKEVIEAALRRHGQAGTVERVISMEAESALPKGENYMSTIYRITLKVVLGNGRRAKRSLILKVAPTEKAKTEMVKDNGVFRRETMMYAVVLKEMEMLMEEFGDTNDVLWCRLLNHVPYTSLLLEDLKASGFRMTRRQDCLDLDHALLVLRSLGRFHAMSKILEQRGVISKDDYKPYSFVADVNVVKSWVYNGLQTLTKAMEEHWGPEWYDEAQKLKVPYEVMQEKMLKFAELDESRFNCLNHGDCWSNNMMFKYDWQNRPYTMRFVDLQIVHYNTPACDLNYCLYGSVNPKLRREHRTQLLDAYHASLESTLDAYGYEGVRLGRNELDQEMDRGFFVAVFAILLTFPVVLSEDKNNFDFEKMLESEGQLGIELNAYCGNYKCLAAPDVKILADKFSKLESMHASRKDYSI